MSSYSFMQWILFFYIYCFIGWVWESCYVSAKQHKWVNRGFMHGPFLPIYGSGAIVILISTIPVKENLILVFIFGMISSTILEFCTGASMEKMFHVRYWDYSNQPFNVKGHICLGVSLGWGAFSILLIRFIHVPVERLVLAIPTLPLDIVTFLLTIYIVGDLVESFNEAMDLKETLMKLSESNEHIRIMQKRLDVIVAVAENDWEEYKDKIQENLLEKEQKKVNRKEYFETALEDNRRRRKEQIQALMDKLEETLKNEDGAMEKFANIKENLAKEIANMQSRTEKQYKRSVRLLRRNPGTVSQKYAEELKEIQSLIQKNKKKKG